MVLCQAVGKQRGHALMKEAVARHDQGMSFHDAVAGVFEQAGVDLPVDALLSARVPGWAPRRARELAVVTRQWLEGADPSD